MATRSGTAAQKKKKKKSKKASAQAGRLSSIYIFALALLLGALTYIPGQSVWAAVRNVCFGLFGWVLYLLAPLTLYIAVLIAARQNWRGKLAIGSGLLLLLCGIALVFSKYEPGDSSFGEMLRSLYQMGILRQGGGVFSVPLGLSLLCWTGRPAADILLIILLLASVMIFADVTPADIFSFLHRTASSARDSAADVLAEADVRRSERRAERQALHAEQESARTGETAVPSENGPDDTVFGKHAGRLRPRIDPKLPPETANKPRDRWDIDVQVNEDIRTEPAVSEETVTVVPLQETRGQAFSPEDYSELSNVLNHDVLVAAGREALKPREEKAVSPAAQPVSHKPLFDQDTPHPTGTGSVFLHTETMPNGTDENSRVYLADAEDQDGPGGEIDDLIRRALDGRPPIEDGMTDDTDPVEVEPDADTAQTVEPVQDEHPSAFESARSVHTAEPTVPSVPVPPPYHLPDVELLDRQPNTDPGNVNSEMRHNAQLLVNTLESFGVHTKILDICRGPSVTRYELQPQAGVKISRITNLADDIALNLAAAGVRIEAPIPGKPAVGIEVPNKVKTTVALRSLIQADEFSGSKAPLTMCLGRDIAGSVKMADLSKMPHLLIAGSTGSGKSVCINSIIMSFLYKSTPDELRMILIDPKVVELAVYNGIPHLLMPVVTDPRKAAGALGSAVAEMERRYQLFAGNNVRDIKSFNRLAEEHDGPEKLPYIAIIIDELADLMMVAGKQVEDYICRIAQKARAAGMHLIVATQRPSVDVITGLIKANIPSRIAFAVSSQVDSRTILDSAGAEKLLGMGDMLFLPVGASKPTRIQGTYVKDEEIERVTDEIRSYASSRYDEDMIADADRRAASTESGSKEVGAETDEQEDGQDPMLRAAIETVVDAKMASTSLLQRKLKLGYARAARIMDTMETLHVIGPYEGSKPRQVLITREQFLEMTMGMPES